MSGDIGRLDLRLRRRSLYGYSVGLGAYALVIVALYPAFRNDTSLDALTAKGSTVAALFGATGLITSPTGWLSANLYANFAPLLVLMLTIGYGAACLAGQDEDGTLCLVATLPVSRRQIVVQKVTALVLLTLPVCAVSLLCVLAGRAFDLDVGMSGLVGVTLGVLLLGVDFGALAMLIGAATGSRSTALAATSALAALSYVVSSLAPVVKWLHPVRYASLFFYAVGDGQLDSGISLAWVGILLAVAAVAVVGCVAAFTRLDVR
jgi:ABC-2 type transport system permease protein